MLAEVECESENHDFFSRRFVGSVIPHWPRQMLLKVPTMCFCLIKFKLTKIHYVYDIHIYFYIHIYIYTHFELNKVIKIMKIKHKRKTTEKATPADVHQPSMLSVTFLAATYFSTSCHLRKVKIIFLYYDSHKK